MANREASKPSKDDLLVRWAKDEIDLDTYIDLLNQHHPQSTAEIDRLTSTTKPESIGAKPQ